MLRGYRTAPVCAPQGLWVQRRGIPTLRTRTMKLFEAPVEFRFYQRYTNNPDRYSGVQFNTHFNSHHRNFSKDAFVDYLNWGRTLGQAHMPHRHQRVAFDFNDSFHPTRIPASAPKPKGWFEGQDPSSGDHPDVSSSFDAKETMWCEPLHANRYHTGRLPGEVQIHVPQDWQTSHLGGELWSKTDAGNPVEFGNAEMFDPHSSAPKKPSIGSVPGITKPYLGEPDRKMMEAMAKPTSKTSTAVCENIGRFSRSLYLNRPDRENRMTAATCDELATSIDCATNGIRTKLVVLKAAQSGLTDAFNSGIDLDDLAHQMRLREAKLAKVKQIDQVLEAAKKSAKKDGSDFAAKATTKALDVERSDALMAAEELLDSADTTLRSMTGLLWRVFSANRPLMTLINGRCRNAGNGVALFAKYSALRDSSEFAHEGPQWGITPFGGMTHLLARTETSLKYPGLAEFIMMTGTPLYAGDALRLGWSDLFSTMPDLDYHIREWFNDSEHMHNDAIAWQLGHLLESLFKMNGNDHSTALERTALTPERARWIEDAFADQPNADSIMQTLSEMEKIPHTDPANTKDINRSGVSSLESVAEGIEKLRQRKLHYTLTPWDVTAPPSDTIDEGSVIAQDVSDLFRQYYFESNGKAPIVHHHNKAKLEKWQQFRKEEYKAFQLARAEPHQRTVFVRLEGCEGTLVSFNFDFDRNRILSELTSADEDAVRVAVLSALRTKANEALGFNAARNGDMLWNLPTFDTAAVRSDRELLQLLHADPGVEDPSNPTEHPPIYFTFARSELHMSEWAFAVKHQLLLQSPFALKASLELLNTVRGDGTEGSVQSVSETLATEFRFLQRTMRRPDFYAVGHPSNRPAEEWAAQERSMATNLNESLSPARPVMKFDDVFERDVELDGHKFALRPKWEPRTMTEVAASDVQALTADLDFEQDGVTEIHAPTQANMASRIAFTIEETMGVEVVPGLGEKSAEGQVRATALASDAHVPTNVNFYEMARHPWKDTATSWRSDGFTEGSQQWFEKKYKEAAQKVYDPQNQSARVYWPRNQEEAQAPGKRPEEGELEPEEVLLKDRFWGAVDRANANVESWAKETRKAAESGTLGHSLEVTTPEEKVYDDEYYRWFIRPGEHPNPSGVLRGGKEE